MNEFSMIQMIDYQSFESYLYVSYVPICLQIYVPYAPMCLQNTNN